MSRFKRQDSRFGLWNLIFAILLIAFALRVYRLDAQSIWWDEGHSIQMASAALAQISTLPGMDVHPPGYFALLHQWMAVAGRSEFALRYLSVIFSLLTVALLMRFGRALDGRHGGWPRIWAGIVAGVLAALSPLYVTYAQEVRMYAMVTFFALASVYFQWRVFASWKVGRLELGRLVGQPANPPTYACTARRRKCQPTNLPTYQPTNLPTYQPTGGSPIWSLVGYVLATAASLYIHYFTVFLLLFQNLVWLVWALAPRKEARLRRGKVAVWLGAQLVTLILFSPRLPMALRQTTAYANPNLNPPGVDEFLPRSWLAYTVGTAVNPVAGGRLAWVLAAILGLVVLFQIVRAWREAGSDQPGTVAFLVGWFLIPLAAYFLVLQRRPSFEPRYMMLITPALVLLLTRGLIGSSRRWLGWAGLGLLVVLIVFAWGTWSYFTNVEAYKDDSAGVAAWLAAETSSDDVVYVDVPHPFHYYAERIPAPTRYLFVDVHTAADILNAEAGGRDRLFWVTWWGSDTDPRGVVPFLLDKAGRRAGELDFKGYHVTWWDLQSDIPFSLPEALSQSDIVFGDVVRLDGSAFSDAARVSEAAWATLHFTLLRDTEVDYRVSLRLRSSTGDMLPPTDKDLLNDRHFRSSAWPLADSRLNQAINVYTLPIPPDTSPGNYCLEAVVYEAVTLEAVPITGVSTSGCPPSAGNGVSARLGTVAVSP